MCPPRRDRAVVRGTLGANVLLVSDQGMPCAIQRRSPLARSLTV